MDDKSRPLDVEKQSECELAAQHHVMVGAIDFKAPDATNNNVLNKTSQPLDTHHVAQSDIVDWEGEDDPAKPMNW